MSYSAIRNQRVMSRAQAILMPCNRLNITRRGRLMSRKRMQQKMNRKGGVMKKQEFLRLMSDAYDQIVSGIETSSKPTKRTDIRQNDSDIDKLLSEQEAAPFIGVKPQTLAKWRMNGNPDAPTFVRIGRNCRYKLSTLRAWMASREEIGYTK